MATEEKELKDKTEKDQAKNDGENAHKLKIELIKTYISDLEMSRETLIADNGFTAAEVDLALASLQSSTTNSVPVAASAAAKSATATDSKVSADSTKTTTSAVESKMTADAATASSGWKYLTWGYWASSAPQPTSAAASQPLAAVSTVAGRGVTVVDDDEAEIVDSKAKLMRGQKQEDTFAQYFLGCRAICKTFKEFDSKTTLESINNDLETARIVEQACNRRLDTIKLFNRVIRTETGTKDEQLHSLIANIKVMQEFFNSENAQKMDNKSFAEHLSTFFTTKNGIKTYRLTEDSDLILMKSAEELRFKLFLKAILQVKKPGPALAVDLKPWTDAIKEIGDLKSKKQASGKP